jgi:hypothetical protein
MSIFKRTIKSSSFSNTAIACVLFLSSAIFTTAQTKIPRSEWTGGVIVPNYNYFANLYSEKNCN